MNTWGLFLNLLAGWIRVNAQKQSFLDLLMSHFLTDLEPDWLWGADNHQLQQQTRWAANLLPLKIRGTSRLIVDCVQSQNTHKESDLHLKQKINSIIYVPHHPLFISLRRCSFLASSCRLISSSTFLNSIQEVTRVPQQAGQRYYNFSVDPANLRKPGFFLFIRLHLNAFF